MLGSSGLMRNTRSLRVVSTKAWMVVKHKIVDVFKYKRSEMVKQEQKVVMVHKCEEPTMAQQACEEDEDPGDHASVEAGGWKKSIFGYLDNGIRMWTNRQGLRADRIAAELEFDRSNP